MVNWQRNGFSLFLKPREKRKTASPPDPFFFGPLKGGRGEGFNFFGGIGKKSLLFKNFQAPPN